MRNIQTNTHVSNINFYKQTKNTLHQGHSEPIKTKHQTKKSSPKTKV